MFSTPPFHHRRLAYHLATCVLETMHQVLIMGITTTRKWPNFVHWLPFVLSFQRALLDVKHKAVSGESERSTSGKFPLVHCELVKTQKDRPGAVTEPCSAIVASHAKATTILDAISETALYWSLLKLPAQMVFLALTLPYAFALLSTSHLHYMETSRRQAGSWMNIGTPLFTIVIVGFALLEARKVDSYSFVQLVIAVIAKTMALRPDWTCTAQRLCRNTSEWISGRMPSHLVSLVPRLPSLRPLGLDHHPFGRHLSFISTSAHLHTTTLIFFADGLGQLPKRWSFLARDCWTWGLGVLLVRGMMAITNKFAEKRDRENDEGYSKVGEESVDELDGADRFGLVDLALGYCISTTIAISLVTIAPSRISLGATDSATVSFVNVKYISMISFAWTALWVIHHRFSAFPDSTQEEDLTMLASQTKAADETSKDKRWIGRALILVAAAPMVIATFRHGLSGSALVSLSGELNGLVSSSTTS